MTDLAELPDGEYVDKLKLESEGKAKYNIISSGIGSIKDCFKKVPNSGMCDKPEGMCDVFLYDMKRAGTDNEDKRCYVPTEATLKNNIPVASKTDFKMFIIPDARQKNEKLRDQELVNRKIAIKSKQFKNLKRQLEILELKKLALSTNSTIDDVQREKDKQTERKIAKKQLMKVRDEAKEVKKRHGILNNLFKNNLQMLFEKKQFGDELNEVINSKNKEIKQLDSEISTITERRNDNERIYELNNTLLSYLKLGLGLLVFMTIIVILILRFSR